MADEYKTIPVSVETKARILALCAAYRMSKRAQGALVGKLVDAEYEKLAALKLVAPVGEPVDPQAGETELRRELRAQA